MITAVRHSTDILSPRDLPSHADSAFSTAIFTSSRISPSTMPVRVAADNCLLRVGLLRSLAKRPEIELLGVDVNNGFLAESFRPHLLLIASRGALGDDIDLIRHIRTGTPGVRILIFGSSKEGPSEFLQYVRAGVRGYLLSNASPPEIFASVLAVNSGGASCPASLCGALFSYFESEGTAIPSAAVRERLGLTRREQQLVPLIARGLTNKEIANHFCLSEQTVKNHLYRMKNKVGAENRFGIVQTCHMHGFLL
jgi:DNA-binding NarL/FixJ family response regulator